MRIALAQILSTADPASNLDQVAVRVAEAASAGADLVVFPEATMRCFGRSLTEVAEPADGPWANRVRQIAAEHRVTVVVGMFTPDAERRGVRVRNTLLVVGPGVDERYDKIHLFDAWGFTESATVAPGDVPVVVDVAGVGVGFATCYDVRFPGLFTALADRGAELICVCASWGSGPGKVAQWELLTRARALDSTTFVAACGQADPAAALNGSRSVPATDQDLVLHEPIGAAPTGVGHSAVISPSGVVLGALGGAPGLLLVDIDPTELPAVRTTLPVLANRRL